MKFSLAFKSFLNSAFGIALVITLAWKLILTITGFAIDTSMGGAISLFDHTAHWDAGWYLTIIYDRYNEVLASSAFYPLFPLLVGGIHILSFGLLDPLISAQLLNTVAVWFGITALLKIGQKIVGGGSKFWLVALLLCAPAAFFMHVFYGEALFIALSFWAYYLALKRQWLGVGILLGLLTMARLPSLLIIALAGLEFMRAYQWNLKKIFNKNLFYFLLAPIGFIAYGTYLFFVQDDFLGMFHAYQATTDWTYQIFNPNILETIARAGYQVIRAFAGLRPVDHELIVNILLPLWSLFLLGLSSLYLILKHRQKLLPLGITGLLAIILFTLNSNVVSAHRYVLPVLTTYIAMILFFKKWKLRRLILICVCAAGVAIQLYLYILFVSIIFAG